MSVLTLFKIACEPWPLTLHSTTLQTPSRGASLLSVLRASVCVVFYRIFIISTAFPFPPASLAWSCAGIRVFYLLPCLYCLPCFISHLRRFAPHVRQIRTTGAFSTLSSNSRRAAIPGAPRICQAPCIHLSYLLPLVFHPIHFTSEFHLTPLDDALPLPISPLLLPCSISSLLPLSLFCPCTRLGVLVGSSLLLLRVLAYSPIPFHSCSSCTVHYSCTSFCTAEYNLFL